jgi:flagellar motor switch protein FliM
LKPVLWQPDCQSTGTVKRQPSRQEIDLVYASREAQAESSAQSVTAFDFRRPDRISKSQLRAIHLLHENFVRSLVSDLSAYLRTYIVMNLVSVEQISYAEFLEGLPPSTFMACLGLKPYEDSAVLEINPSLVFPILEMLLGGSGKSEISIQREITDIEQNLMDGLLRIILRNLSGAWKSVTTIDFSIQSLDTEPQFLQAMAPSEAVVAVGLEMRIGESTGLMNFAMPSLMIKMMRQKFDQQWSVRKAASMKEEQQRMLRLLQPAYIQIDGRLVGPTMRLEELLNLKLGQVMVFDYPTDKPVQCTLNGQPQFLGHVVRMGRKRALRLVSPATESLSGYKVPQ